MLTVLRALEPSLVSRRILYMTSVKLLKTNGALTMRTFLMFSNFTP